MPRPSQSATSPSKALAPRAATAVRRGACQRGALMAASLARSRSPWVRFTRRSACHCSFVRRPPIRSVASVTCDPLHTTRYVRPLSADPLCPTRDFGSVRPVTSVLVDPLLPSFPTPRPCARCQRVSLSLPPPTPRRRRALLLQQLAVFRDRPETAGRLAGVHLQHVARRLRRLPVQGAGGRGRA